MIVFGILIKKNMMDKLAVEDTFKGFLGFFKSMGAFDYRTDLFSVHVSQILMSVRLVTTVRVLLHVVILMEATLVCALVDIPNLVNMAAQVCHTIKKSFI